MTGQQIVIGKILYSHRWKWIKVKQLTIYQIVGMYLEASPAYRTRNSTINASDPVSGKCATGIVS